MQNQVPEEGYEPKQKVCEIHPDCVFHSDLAVLVRCWVGVDVEFSEDAEEDCP
jgi:hypothetical protein